MPFAPRVVAAKALLLFALPLVLAACGNPQASERSTIPETRISVSQVRLPWRLAGLTEREAAIHLLDRFSFGPRPGDIDRVIAEGPEQWLASQLNASSSDNPL